MIAYIICIEGLESSMAGASKTLESHEEVGNQFELRPFQGSTPATVIQDQKDLGYNWTWPWDEPSRCPHTGMMRHPYKTANRLARMACLASHALLWEKCAAHEEPIIILEDDAIWVRRLDPEKLLKIIPGGWGAIFLNDPRGATRRAGVYHAALVNAGEGRIIQVLWVDNQEVPQGGPGASAYLIQPWAAKLALAKLQEIGGWPNDALLCRQLAPWLGVSTTSYTSLSGRASQLA